MKKLFAILLAVAMFASMATVASAAENTTTLTTTVPAATYTLIIPADQKIEFGATSTDLGSITVTNATGFAEGKNLKVVLSYEGFKCADTTTTIPFSIRLDTASTNNDTDRVNISSGDAITFTGLSSGAVKEYVTSWNVNRFYDLEQTFLLVNSEDWGKALAGEYTATITYTAEVVVE